MRTCTVVSMKYLTMRLGAGCTVMRAGCRGVTTGVKLSTVYLMDSRL